MGAAADRRDANALATNRKARHEYQVLENFEAGIVLTGTEVKSCREAGVNLTDSYAAIQGGELFLIGTHIAPYAQGNIFNHEPRRKRKLLMHRREILRLKRNIEAKGLTLIPLAFYFGNRGRIKVELGLCRGKNTVDKREDLKKKMDDIEVRRAMTKR